jgi:ribose transport system substrate-binding protein
MSDTFTVAVVPQGSTHQYWKLMEAGAAKAVRDLKTAGVLVDLIWKGPIREGDHEEHKQIVENFVRKGVDGIVLSPFDSQFLVHTVEDAARKEIPTVVIDSELDTQRIVGFVGTDNKRAGALAADRMSELLRGHGRVYVQRYQRGSASTEARENGFIERIKSAHPHMDVQRSSEYAGGTRDSAKRAAEAGLGKQIDNFQGVFTPNESSTTGMLMALSGLPRSHTSKIMFVGFDHSDTLTTAMQCGQIQGLILQNPFRMGELGVKTLVDHLQGHAVSSRTDTGAILVTSENLGSAMIQQLLHPQLVPA